jgi:hypothetical protein
MVRYEDERCSYGLFSPNPSLENDQNIHNYNFETSSYDGNVITSEEVNKIQVPYTPGRFI